MYFEQIIQFDVKIEYFSNFLKMAENGQKIRVLNFFNKSIRQIEGTGFPNKFWIGI